jgi:hypothetical protein
MVKRLVRSATRLRRYRRAYRGRPTTASRPPREYANRSASISSLGMSRQWPHGAARTARAPHRLVGVEERGSARHDLRVAPAAHEPHQAARPRDEHRLGPGQAHSLLMRNPSASPDEVSESVSGSAMVGHLLSGHVAPSFSRGVRRTRPAARRSAAAWRAQGRRFPTGDAAEPAVTGRNGPQADGFRRRHRNVPAPRAETGLARRRESTSGSARRCQP